MVEGRVNSSAVPQVRLDNPGRRIPPGDSICRYARCYFNRAVRWVSQPVRALRHVAKLVRPNINAPGYWDRRYAGMDTWREEVYVFLVPLLKKMERDPGGIPSLDSPRSLRANGT